MDDWHDRRGTYTDWSDIDLAPGGRDWKPPTQIPREPQLRTPTPLPIAAPQAVVAPQTRTWQGAPEPRPPVSEERGGYLFLKHLAGIGDWAAIKQIRDVLKGTDE